MFEITTDVPLIEFDVFGKPQGKQRARTTIRGQHVHSYTPEETEIYEAKICVAFNNARQLYRIGVGELANDDPKDIIIDAVYPIPKSFSKKKRELALKGEIKPQTKPDIDNIAKVVMDALNGVAFADDKNVTGIFVFKRYGEVAKLNIQIIKAS